MFTLRVNVSGMAAAQSAAQRLEDGLDQRQVNTLIGRAALQATKDHLYGLANTRHRQHVGLNFYKDAGDAVSNVDLDNGAEIRIDKAGIAQRYYGGTIKAVNYSHLWIPIAEESEGRSASEFTGMVKLINKATNKGVAVMPGKDPKTGNPSVKLGTALFALVPEVTQDADPSVLPSDEDYLDAFEAAIGDVLGDVTNMGDL